MPVEPKPLQEDGSFQGWGLGPSVHGPSPALASAFPVPLQFRQLLSITRCLVLHPLPSSLLSPDPASSETLPPMPWGSPSPQGLTAAFWHLLALLRLLQ